MNTATSAQAMSYGSPSADGVKRRFPSIGSTPESLADIYKEETNIAIWKRELGPGLQNDIRRFLKDNPHFTTSMTVSPESARAAVGEALGEAAPAGLADDVAELVEMFCCLFELKCTGLRLATLDSAMCPRFHVDKVPCRLVMTYSGVTTEWLPHEVVDRSKLGLGSNGLPDLESGLFQHEDQIQRMSCGDVALLKGEIWYRNENAGLVHRSPDVPPGQNRLLLTLDISN